MATKPNIPNGKAAIIAMYGNPTENGKLSQSWQSANIVTMTLPYPMRLAWDKDTVVRKISVHRAVANDLTAILTAIYDEARRRVKASHSDPEGQKGTKFYDDETLKLLGSLGLDLYGGAFNYRKIRGGSSLSMHSWGIAIDIDPERNGLGDTTPAMPLWAVSIFEEYGWLWGGRWTGSRCDGMHFQRATGA